MLSQSELSLNLSLLRRLLPPSCSFPKQKEGDYKTELVLQTEPGEGTSFLTNLKWAESLWETFPPAPNKAGPSP